MNYYLKKVAGLKNLSEIISGEASNENAQRQLTTFLSR
jgi:hypothetical protein